MRNFIDILPLHKSMLSAGIPVESVVVGKEEDRSTWRVVYSSEATKEQMILAQSLVDSFNPELDTIQKHAINRVQFFMDAKAQEYGYDHILSASTYSASTFSKFQAEGIAFAKWRDDVWTHCFNILAEWEAGTSKITTEDELIASLPEFKVIY